MSKYLKALYGAATAGLGTFSVAYADGVVTGQEWVTVAIATFAALGVIWAVPNTKSEAQDVAERRAEAQAITVVKHVAAALATPAEAPASLPPAAEVAPLVQ